MKSHKIIAIKIQHFFHDTLWSRYFLPGILFLVLVMTFVQLYLNIFHPPDQEDMRHWRMWVIFVLSTIGTFSGLCGTYFVNRRSIKWVYFQFVTIPTLVLALAFSFLPLQALMWAGMSIPAVLMYRIWNKQIDRNSIKPQKLSSKKLICYFILATYFSILLGFIILELDIIWTPFSEDTKFKIDVAPFADAFILVFTLSAPFLIAKRYWAGNYFFMVANTISILLFSGAIGTHAEANSLFVIQNIIYFFYSLIGISSWIVVYNQQHNNH